MRILFLVRGLELLLRILFIFSLIKEIFEQLLALHEYIHIQSCKNGRKNTCVIKFVLHILNSLKEFNRVSLKI